MENLSYTLFLQFLRNISRSHGAVKQFDPGCRCCALAAVCLPQSSALVLLMSPHERQNLGLVWVGNELSFGSLLLSKQSFELWGWHGNVPCPTGCCPSDGELIQHCHKWCCQCHHGSLRNERLFWVNCSSKKYH